MNSQMRWAKELMGLPVLSVAEGQRLGTISALFIDRDARAVAAIGVSGGAFTRAHHLRFADLQTIGADAVMIAAAAIAQKGLPAAELRELDDRLAGRSVVTESGRQVGEIEGYAVNTTTGRLESYQVRPETSRLARLTGLGKPEALEIPDAQVVALGAHALILRDDAVPPGESFEPADA
jgi:uncharacterized protein YrrD